MATDSLSENYCPVLCGCSPSPETALTIAPETLSALPPDIYALAAIASWAAALVLLCASTIALWRADR